MNIRDYSSKVIIEVINLDMPFLAVIWVLIHDVSAVNDQLFWKPIRRRDLN